MNTAAGALRLASPRTMRQVALIVAQRMTGKRVRLDTAA